jgi:hypothetical protein
VRALVNVRSHHLLTRPLPRAPGADSATDGAALPSLVAYMRLHTEHWKVVARRAEADVRCAT